MLLKYGLMQLMVASTDIEIEKWTASECYEWFLAVGRGYVCDNGMVYSISLLTI
jgi:hypothetical protein